jgi:hypothetical protein
MGCRQENAPDYREPEVVAADPTQRLPQTPEGRAATSRPSAVCAPS